jgi:hypothetical protein
MKRYALTIIAALAATALAIQPIQAAPPSTPSTETKPVHLFLLSGQSNMAGMNPDKVFAPEIKKHFGEENVVIVKVAKNGEPIRRWYQGWKVEGKKKPGEIGNLYAKLMEETKTAMSGKSVKSVTLLWMQGERDAKEGLSDQYEEAFLGLLGQIKTDLKVEQVNYIIGRLSDAGLGQKDWDNIRAIQQKLGEAGPRAAWVNTDDLNDHIADKPNDLHYSKDGYDLLAKRYVEKVKEIVK